MLLACLWAAVSARAQATLVVDRLARPGTTHAVLQMAVAAARAGDTIVLRATSTSAAEAYEAPAITGKAVHITGEPGAARPIVVGPWQVRGVPAGQVLVLRHLELASADERSFALRCTGCAGAIVLEDVRCPGNGAAVSHGHGFTGTYFTDCRLVVVRDSTIDTGGGPWEPIRTQMVVERCRLTSSLRGAGARGTLFADNARLYLVDSTVAGPSDAPSVAFATCEQASSAIVTCASDIYLAGRCRLSGGVGRGGARYPPIGLEYASSAGRLANASLPSVCHVDPATTLDGPALFPGIADLAPQTGLTCEFAASRLRIDHHCVPQSLSFLAIGPLATSPWQQELAQMLVGPVFVDVEQATFYSDLTPASGVLTRTIEVPDLLPAGALVCLQAADLLTTGGVLTSNPTIVGNYR